MSQFVVLALVAAVSLGRQPADDKTSTSSGRALQLSAIQSEFKKANDDLVKSIRVGATKPGANGEYREWTEIQRRFAKQARGLIDGDPSDAVGLDAIVFCLNDLQAGESERDLYEVLVKHHAASEKIDPLIRSPLAPLEFLRLIAAKSPHSKIRLWARYHMAAYFNENGKSAEAEPILEELSHDSGAKELGGYGGGSLADGASRLLFEIQRLCVGREVPEIEGRDLENKPMKLSESRNNKVTLLVFWATWCGPCMAMVPHERALAERYAGKPFVIVGVNGDMLPDDSVQFKSADGKVIDQTQRVRAAIAKERITWRSFRNGQYGIGPSWNVLSWPTVYLIDHRGVIAGKWKGDPGANNLDVAIEKLVQVALAAKLETRK